MTDTPEYVAPIIAGLFFLAAVIAGACLYYFYLKTRKGDGEQGTQKTNSFTRNYGAYNPFAFYVAGVSPIEFSSAPFTIEIEGERNIASKCCVVEEHCNLPEKLLVCRSISCDKPLRSPCRLQVIQEEAEEENEDLGEANEVVCELNKASDIEAYSPH